MKYYKPIILYGAIVSILCIIAILVTPLGDKIFHRFRIRECLPLCPQMAYLKDKESKTEIIVVFEQKEINFFVKAVSAYPVFLYSLDYGYEQYLSPVVISRDGKIAYLFRANTSNYGIADIARAVPLPSGKSIWPESDDKIKDIQLHGNQIKIMDMAKLLLNHPLEFPALLDEKLLKKAIEEACATDIYTILKYRKIRNAAWGIPLYMR